MKIERRFVPDMEIRVEGEARRISGHFAVFDRFSPTYGRFREKIAPGFFDEALTRSDTVALFNHDNSKILGRQSAGTLRLAVDGTGLHGVIDPVPNTPTGNEVMENLSLGNLKGASFAFSVAPDGDTFIKAADGVLERTLLKAGELFDVSVVTTPFYPQAGVAARGVEASLDGAFADWEARTAPEAPEAPAAPEKGPELVHELLDLISLGG